MKFKYIILYGLLQVIACKSKAQDINTPRVGGSYPSPYHFKKSVSCSSFEPIGAKNATNPMFKLVRNDSTFLPKNFPLPPTGASQCGCVKSVHQAYFLSTLGEMQIFNYYKDRLSQIGFKVTDPPGLSDKESMVMRFSDSGGIGYVQVFPDKFAFSIMYLKSNSGCGCLR